MLDNFAWHLMIESMRDLKLYRICFHGVLYTRLVVCAHMSCYVSSWFEFNICFMSTVASLLSVPSKSQIEIGALTLSNMFDIQSTLITPISTSYYLELGNAITI